MIFFCATYSYYFYFCKMIKLIVWGIVFYLIYKFVFELLVPVTKATSQMKDKIQEMQEQQQKMKQQQQEQQNNQKKDKPTVDKGDYIDYEEIK